MIIRVPAPAAPADEEGGGGGGGGDIEGDANMLDVDDFTTWSPATWHLLPFDKISFPSDPNVSICSIRSYMALAMILYHDEGLRSSQQRI